jgi:hypothetical protein
MNPVNPANPNLEDIMRSSPPPCAPSPSAVVQAFAADRSHSEARVGGGIRSPLRAHVDYDDDGALLFRLSGLETERFARVLGAFRRAVPIAEREWLHEQDAWVVFGGWDDELLEILEDHFGPEEIFLCGHPLGVEDPD